jgi:hypothetical protein
MTDSVIPASRNCALIAGIDRFGMKIRQMRELAFLAHPVSQFLFRPYAMRRLLCAATRRVICGNSSKRGASGKSGLPGSGFDDFGLRSVSECFPGT